MSVTFGNLGEAGGAIETARAFLLLLTIKLPCSAVLFVSGLEPPVQVNLFQKPQYDKRLFLELQVQYMKTTRSECFV